MADLRTEMSNFLSNGGKDAPKGVETPVEKKANEDKTPVEGQDQDEIEQKQEEKNPVETQETESDEEKKDDESKDEDEEADKKSKKPNRYQRLKTQRDDAIKSNKQLQTHVTHAVKVANAWRAEAKAIEREFSEFQKQAKAKGVARTPEQDQLFDYRKEAEVRQVEDEFDKKSKEDSIRQQAEEFKSALKQRFTDEASNLVEKYGLNDDENSTAARKLLIRFHTERSSGSRLSMEEVAKEMAELETVRNRGRSDSRQLDANRRAPKIMKPGVSVKVDYPATPEGMKKFLVAQGLTPKDG